MGRPLARTGIARVRRARPRTTSLIKKPCLLLLTTAKDSQPLGVKGRMWVGEDVPRQLQPDVQRHERRTGGEEELDSTNQFRP